MWGVNRQVIHFVKREKLKSQLVHFVNFDSKHQFIWNLYKTCVTIDFQSLQSKNSNSWWTVMVQAGTHRGRRLLIGTVWVERLLISKINLTSLLKEISLLFACFFFMHYHQRQKFPCNLKIHSLFLILTVFTSLRKDTWKRILPNNFMDFVFVLKRKLRVWNYKQHLRNYKRTRMS